MIIKKNIKILTELLNIDGVKGQLHRQYKGIGIILQIESIKMESVCPIILELDVYLIGILAVSLAYGRTEEPKILLSPTL
ncbi:MAG: hypothetical protein AAF915_29825 [Cyanobacteria bacterium P01_D01_bin.50]